MELNPPNKLVKHCSGVLESEGPGPWPSTVIYAGDTYYRFHDFIYLRCPIEELDESQVITICKVRGARSTTENTQQNLDVRGKFRVVTDSYRPKCVLEVGPGNQPLFSAEQQDFCYRLAELDQSLVEELATRGYSVSPFSADTPLEQPSSSVDLILAIFVLQFAFGGSQVSEIARVLRPSGLMLANVYRRSSESRERLRMQFTDNGLYVDAVKNGDGIGHGHEYWLMGRELSTPQSEAAKRALLELIHSRG